MSTINTSHILSQLKADLIGKDSFRGVTLTYSWLANQFGHFALGFIPAILLNKWMLTRYDEPSAALWSALITGCLWTLFEIYNFLGPLLLKKKTSSRFLYVPAATYTFPPCWGNIAFDTSTDVLFFWLGALSSSLFCHYSFPVFIALVVVAGLVAYPSAYWFQTKLYLQSAKYPFQYRLAQFTLPLSIQNREKVNRFMSEDAMHLLVFGDSASGKTSLSVGIATELSIRHASCTYTTAVKLCNSFFEGPRPADIWNWRSASLLVIDDVNPGKPVKERIVTPELFRAFLDTYSFNQENREAVRHQKVIWVLGDHDDAHEREWRAMLEEIGVAADRIIAIDLGEDAGSVTFLEVNQSLVESQGKKL